MFKPVHIDSEHSIHPKDFDKASSVDFHGEQKSMRDATRHADFYGHHNPEFLHNLKESLKVK
jgi:hypothetical protein